MTEEKKVVVEEDSETLGDTDGEEGDSETLGDEEDEGSKRPEQDENVVTKEQGLPSPSTR